jgi:virulence-associated protein VapD
MPKYAIAFDLETAAMKSDYLEPSEITQIYQSIPDALRSCGVTDRLQKSLYHVEMKEDHSAAITRLRDALHRLAPDFRHYVSRVHIYRVEEWSDVTALFLEAPLPIAPLQIDPSV